MGMPMNIPQDWVVEVDCQGEHFKFSSNEVLMIDRNQIDDELARQASWYARFAVLYERSQAARLDVEADQEELEARVSGPIRESLSKIHKAKLTEKVVMSQVILHPEVQALRKKIRRMAAIESDLKVVVNALVQRKDCIVAMARTRNFELSTPSPAEVDRAKRHLGMNRS